MKMHSIEEIEAMFRAMGLGSEADRQKFLSMVASESGERSQIFIRVDAWTAQEKEDPRAQLA
jgi:predicted KAP-like P-loop ATPase